MKCFFIGLLLFILCCSGFSQALSDDTLHWTSYRKLSWTDFKGTPIDLPSMVSQSMMSMSAKFAKQTIFLPTKTIVETVFDKKNSWVSETGRTPQNLRYYQVLFDLYEVSSRKLRKEFKETKFGVNPNQIFQTKYNLALTSLSDRIKQYMSETKMGANEETVQKWYLVLQGELRELENYQ